MTTPVCTDAVVTEIDTLQHASGEGPCLDALRRRGPLYAEDLGDDARWPVFGPEAVARGCGACSPCPCASTGRRAPSTSTPARRGPSASIDRGRALLLATLAGLAFTAARAHDEEERKATQLQAALATREMIGQAQGILMERERISPDQAFDILRQASQHLNIKLRVVAQSLVDTGERPETGRPVDD